MKILAIDPGPTQSAYVVWDGKSVSDKGIVPNFDMLAAISEKSALGEVGELAIEKIACYGMAVGEEVFETVFWTGRFAEAWLHNANSQAERITRLDIKIHICHSAKAKDANIRQALIDRFGDPGKKAAPGALFGVTSHCWAALAVAVCFLDRLERSA